MVRVEIETGDVPQNEVLKQFGYALRKAYELDESLFEIHEGDSVCVELDEELSLEAKENILRSLETVMIGLEVRYDVR